MSAFFGKSKRLLSKSDFKNLFSGSKKHRFESFSIIQKENNFKTGRLGISISKKVYNAVWRNKVKRITREGFRLNNPSCSDFLVIIHRPLRSLKLYRNELNNFFNE